PSLNLRRYPLAHQLRRVRQSFMIPLNVNAARYSTTCNTNGHQDDRAWIGIREIRDKCIESGTAFLFKHWAAELRNPLSESSMVSRGTSFLPASYGRGNST